MGKIVGAVVVFAIGLYQYRQGQKWKRREFIAAQVKDFEADIKMQLAMAMLDWNDRVLYFPCEGSSKVCPIRVDDNLARAALLPHDKVNGYFKNEALIRDCFDRFLHMLARLSAFDEAKLIHAEELAPYLDYWIHSMSGEKKHWHTPAFYTLLHHYIRFYGFAKITRLMEDFGCKVDPTEEEVNRAAAEALSTRPPGAELTVPEERSGDERSSIDNQSAGNPPGKTLADKNRMT